MTWEWLLLADDVEVSGPVPPERVAEAEAAVGAFPPEYRSFVVECGTATIGHRSLAGLGAVPPYMDVVAETKLERTVPGRALPTDLLAVHNDGGGNIYCVRVDGTGEQAERDAVFAWWHDDDSTPELVAGSFDGWVRSFFEPDPTEDG